MATGSRSLRPRRPVGWVELFVPANLAFLAVDIGIAHSVNEFARWEEWIPVAISVAAPLVLLLVILRGGPDEIGRRSRTAGFAVGAASVAVGVAGMVLHLQSQFFEEQSLHNLVYTAPFVAPLAYAGLGMLLVLDRMVDAGSREWAQWVLFLALGGFAGNFALSLADHAQNGFFDWKEWIPVAASAVAVGCLLAAVVRPLDRPFLRVCLGVMAGEAAVGALGAVFHVVADLPPDGGSFWSGIVYGAPPFAPMLFADLAVLAAIGLVALLRAE